MQRCGVEPGDFRPASAGQVRDRIWHLHRRISEFRLPGWRGPEWEGIEHREAIAALSSVLWGYTSKASLNALEQFFPEPKSAEKKADK